MQDLKPSARLTKGRKGLRFAPLNPTSVVGPFHFARWSYSLSSRTDNLPTDSSSALRALAERSESLLADLSSSRDDVLAPVDLNRMLRQVLTNQAALLRTMAGGDLSDLNLASQAVSASAGQGAEEQAPAGPPSNAEAFLGVKEALGEGRSRACVAAFDHRDRDFNSGLEKLNRWTEGNGGTPFQVREDVAYLNVGSSADSAQRYEKNLMERMGFNRRLGRLTTPGLSGEIVVYERS